MCACLLFTSASVRACGACTLGTWAPRGRPHACQGFQEWLGQGLGSLSPAARCNCASLLGAGTPVGACSVVASSPGCHSGVSVSWGAFLASITGVPTSVPRPKGQACNSYLHLTSQEGAVANLQSPVGMPSFACTWWWCGCGCTADSKASSLSGAWAVHTVRVQVGLSPVWSWFCLRLGTGLGTAFGTGWTNVHRQDHRYVH